MTLIKDLYKDQVSQQKPGQPSMVSKPVSPTPSPGSLPQPQGGVPRNGGPTIGSSLVPESDSRIPISRGPGLMMGRQTGMSPQGMQGVPPTGSGLGRFGGAQPIQSSGRGGPSTYTPPETGVSAPAGNMQMPGPSPADETVSGTMTSLLDRNNPYMQQARHRAQQYAASRGLQNSAMAAGFGEEAAISAALPIAQQDAGFRQNLRQQTHGANLQSGLQNVASMLARGEMRLSNELQKDILELNEGLRRGTMTHDANLQARLADINAALQQEVATHGAGLQRGTMSHQAMLQGGLMGLGSELSREEATHGAGLQAGLMGYGSGLQRGEMALGSALQRGEMRLGSRLSQQEASHGAQLQQGLMGFGANLEAGLMNVADQIKQGQMQLSTDLQSDILSLQDQIQRGQMTHGAQLEASLATISERLKQETMGVGAGLEAGLMGYGEQLKQSSMTLADMLQQGQMALAGNIESRHIQERTTQAIRESWTNTAQQLQLNDQTHVQALERMGVDQANLLDRMYSEQRFNMEKALVAGSQEIQKMVIAEIGAINRTEGLTAVQQNSATDQVIARAREYMGFLGDLTSTAPSWDPLWADMPNFMPSDEVPAPAPAPAPAPGLQESDVRSLFSKWQADNQRYSTREGRGGGRDG